MISANGCVFTCEVTEGCGLSDLEIIQVEKLKKSWQVIPNGRVLRHYKMKNHAL